MNFERPRRPADVEQAIKSGDKEKIVAFAKAGGKASAQRRFERDVHAELDQEMHEKGMRQAATDRNDDLLPADD